jgi:hypothetical protein
MNKKIFFIALLFATPFTSAIAGPRWISFESELEYRGPVFNDENAYLEAMQEKCVDVLTPKNKAFLESQKLPHSNADVRAYLINSMNLTVQDWTILPSNPDKANKVEFRPDGSILPMLRFRFTCGYGST